jgi:hypothetical protein
MAAKASDTPISFRIAGTRANLPIGVALPDGLPGDTSAMNGESRSCA